MFSFASCGNHRLPQFQIIVPELRCLVSDLNDVADGHARTYFGEALERIVETPFLIVPPTSLVPVLC